jgi:hypothetical protein
MIAIRVAACLEEGNNLFIFTPQLKFECLFANCTPVLKVTMNLQLNYYFLSLQTEFCKSVPTS